MQPRVKNLTSILNAIINYNYNTYEDANPIYGLTQWIKDSVLLEASA